MGLPSAADIIDLIKKGLTVDAQAQIVRLREEAISLQEENFRLRQRMMELEKESTVRANMTYDGTVYWKQGPDSSQKEGPFCPLCLDKEGRPIHLVAASPGGGTDWTCYSCNYGFGKSSQRW